jgi:predicted nucleotidyltransferase
VDDYLKIILGVKQMRALSSAIINQIAHSLEQKSEVTMAFLFGSYSKGTARLDSDLDIAIFLKEPYQMEWVREIWGQMESISGKDVDLVLLNTAPATLCWSAIRGIKLTIKDQKQYLEYMLNCSREAEDFQEFIFDLWRLRQEYKEANNVTPL